LWNIPVGDAYFRVARRRASADTPVHTVSITALPFGDPPNVRAEHHHHSQENHPMLEQFGSSSLDALEEKLMSSVFSLAADDQDFDDENLDDDLDDDDDDDDVDFDDDDDDDDEDDDDDDDLDDDDDEDDDDDDDLDFDVDGFDEDDPDA
jgi:DNA-directed RNA polymerase subunit delta